MFFNVIFIWKILMCIFLILPLHIAAMIGNVEIVKKLVFCIGKIDIGLNATDKNGIFCIYLFNCTPLHIACLRNFVDIVTILLEQKTIDTNVKNISSKLVFFM